MADQEKAEGALGSDGASEYNNRNFDARDHYGLLETEEEAEMPGNHGVGGHRGLPDQQERLRQHH